MWRIDIKAWAYRYSTFDYLVRNDSLELEGVIGIKAR